MQVSRLDANKWAVSARGMASRFSGKLLVLIDGRSVYTPGFSGVYREQAEVPMVPPDYWREFDTQAKGSGWKSLVGRC